MWKVSEETRAHYRVDEIVEGIYVLTVSLLNSSMDPSWVGFVNLFYKTPCGQIIQVQVGFIDEDDLSVAKDLYETYYLANALADPKTMMQDGIRL